MNINCWHLKILNALIDAALIDAALIDPALIDPALIDAALIDAALIDAALKIRCVTRFFELNINTRKCAAPRVFLI